MPLIEVHNHNHVDLDKVLKSIDQLHKLIKKVATKQELQAALDEVSGALENIGNDIIRLTEQIQNGGLNTQEEDDVLAQIKAIGERAKTIAGQTPEGNENPNPETPGEGEQPA